MANSNAETSKGSLVGYAQALSAYALWGIFPLYWKLLPDVGSVEIICHRIVWSLLTILVCLVSLRQWPAFRDAFRSWRKVGLSSLAAVLITINWLAFIWAVSHDRILEASLGYFINPLLTVLLAVILFREKLTSVQWLAIAIAFFGVAIMSLEANRFPWIAFFLSSSFACYAAVKKKTKLSALPGLGLETAILTPIALPLIYYFATQIPAVESLSQIANFHPSTAQISGEQLTVASSRPLSTWLLLALGGPVTTLPLLLFAAAAHKVPLVAMGMLQYIGPTIQFLIAVFVYHEDISAVRLIGFCFVWGALAIFTWSSLAADYRNKHRP